MRNSIPPATLTLTLPEVRALLRRFQPNLAELPLEPFGSGWDNTLLRLGERWLLRLPRRQEAVALLANEVAWLPRLAERLPIPVPAPVRSAPASDLFPAPWSLVTWLPGVTANREPPGIDQAERWADFLLALHEPAPAEAPANPLRGVPLAQRREHVERRLRELEEAREIEPGHLALWEETLAAPQATETVWLHGDLHPRNVLVEAGGFSGVIDWGDLTAGDPATDLASVWTLFPSPEARERCLARYAPSPALRTRARGWALFFGSMLLATAGNEDPEQAAMGRATLARLVES